MFFDRKPAKKNTRGANCVERSQGKIEGGRELLGRRTPPWKSGARQRRERGGVPECRGEPPSCSWSELMGWSHSFAITHKPRGLKWQERRELIQRLKRALFSDIPLTEYIPFRLATPFFIVEETVLPQ